MKMTTNCHNEPCIAFDDNVGEELADLVLMEQRLDAHFAAHKCDCGDPRSPDYIGGFIHCPEAKALYERLPAERRVELG